LADGRTGELEFLTFRPSGIIPPNVTPFTRDGSLDVGALRGSVRFWLESGIHGLACCASNGEAPYLSREERRAVIEAVIDEVNGRVPVIVGTGSVSTSETILLTMDAQSLGAAAALVVTPFFYKPNSKEIHEHFRAILDAVDIPIIPYNVPKFTGYSIEPSLVAQLAEEYENVVAVKDSSGSIAQITETIRLCGRRISVLAGTADLILPTLEMGGKGGIVAVANVAPRMCVELYDAFMKKDLKKARDLQIKITYLNEVLVKRYNQLSAIKESLNLIGVKVGQPRRPSLPLDEKAREDVSKTLIELGLMPPK
jgi:4-hydroxy-tetrahydrodipicolinate synthase